MKKYWKLLEAWVTELKSDPFEWAYMKLTVFYTLSIVLVFVITNITLFGIWSTMFNRVTHGIINPQFQNRLSSYLDIALSREGWAVYIILLTTIIVASFLINSRTLSPIRNIMRAQKRFIADASHELRTPLAIMRTNSEIVLLDGDNINPTEARDTFISNLEEIDRMSKLIQNLLELSFYDNRFVEIPLEEVALSRIVMDISEKFKSIADKKEVDLRLRYMDPGIIMANPVAIERMVTNLIKNAITYTPEGGQVSISVTTKHSTIEFKVKDTGIGIDKKDLPNVFNPFYKSGQGRVHLERESSGLGLTIVKRIVELHKGSIYLNSEVGKGTTIAITLPLHLTRQS